MNFDIKCRMIKKFESDEVRHIISLITDAGERDIYIDESDFDNNSILKNHIDNLFVVLMAEVELKRKYKLRGMK